MGESLLCASSCSIRLTWSTWRLVSLAAVIMDLDRRLPQAITLLGRPVVLWWDRNNSKWQAFLDQCPHRLAPLSEGRIDEAGNIACSYHGWSFDGSGACTKIPQAPATGPPVHASPKACATVFPCVEQHGLVWVWLDTSAAGREKAAAQRPPQIPEMDDPSFVYDVTMRDMPYGWEALIENLMDPSHVPFAHHKIMGNRKDGKPLDLKVKKIDRDGFIGASERGIAKYTAPNLFTLEINLPPKQKKSILGKTGVLFTSKKEAKQDDLASKQHEPLQETDTNSEGQEKTIASNGKFGHVESGAGTAGGAAEVVRRMVLMFLCVPMAPGRSKLIVAFPRNFATWAAKLYPRWLTHLGQMTILDSDLIFLHLMERRLQDKNWLKAVYVPTSADSFVTAFRRWLATFGGERPFWGPSIDPALPPTAPKEVLMERQHSHVLQCSSCQGALGNFQRLQLSLQFLSYAAVAFLSITAITRRPEYVVASPWPFLGLSVLSGVLAHLLSKWIYRKYYYSDYIHGLID
eukprot:SM000425S15897  [mRNA]  locus=s425:12918:16164:- [translate_table: standard]